MVGSSTAVLARVGRRIVGDPRISIALILLGYLLLGFTVLGFNRSPFQAVMTSVSACGFEMILCRIFRGKWMVPLSALITSLSLSILLNYSHDFFILFVPVFFAIGTKYVFTFQGRHVFNPALAGVTLSLVFAGSLITAAPSYQWNGIESMSVFMAMLAIFFLLPKVRRHAIVISFLLSFTILTALRAWVMRWHLPFETLFLGTLTSPAFFLFTFFMITDPMTSPSSTKGQIWTGVALAVIDLLFHLRQSYFTFFYAAFALAAAKLVFFHWRAAVLAGSPWAYLRAALWSSGYWKRPLVLGALAVGSVGFYRAAVSPRLEVNQLEWTFEEADPSHTGIRPQMGDVLTRVDPRIHHLSKWLLSVGDAVAAGDYDRDGLQDLFFTFPLKRDQDRNALYRNLGDFRFERVALPAIADRTRDIEHRGVGTAAMFVDHDNDGDLDLFVVYASGEHVLLQNRLSEEGVARFADVSEESGLGIYGNGMAANFLDINRDGLLDLLVGNVLPTELPDYEEPTRLNLFALPAPEFDGDERMFNFMHSSWHMSDNGGRNDVFMQQSPGLFGQKDSTELGLPETFWTLAIGTGDLNRDGYTDLYVANDFGPDDLYFNVGGERFESIEGEMFGSIGRDTYKGMNASVADLDNNGWLDVYVSNVHHALQAEGSLLWMFGPPSDGARPQIRDRATQSGALNEDRFGWGASTQDFDNDGWLDIAQANGMVDDEPDRRFEECPDYWYVNEKIARSPPWIHRYANKWGDIRGFCIYGKERNRLYKNLGASGRDRFVDVAQAVGLTEASNSRAMAAVDLDNDGRLDLVVTHQFKGPSIYRNRLKPQEAPNHWIGFELVGDGVRCNRGAIGSVVKVKTTTDLGNQTQMREAQVVNGFSGQDDRRIHFGLGAAAGVVDVTVSWCLGQEARYTRARAGSLPPAAAAAAVVITARRRGASVTKAPSRSRGGASESLGLHTGCRPKRPSTRSSACG